MPLGEPKKKSVERPGREQQRRYRVIFRMRFHIITIMIVQKTIFRANLFQIERFVADQLQSTGYISAVNSYFYFINAWMFFFLILLWHMRLNLWLITKWNFESIHIIHKALHTWKETEFNGRLIQILYRFWDFSKVTKVCKYSLMNPYSCFNELGKARA